MKIGGIDIQDCKLGSTQINEVRRGTELIWPEVLTPNTFIGGVAATIPDAQSLATKFSTTEYPLTASDISYFAVVGSDIEAIIDINYQIPNSAFENNTSITFFEDTGAKLNKVGSSAFYLATSIRKFHTNANTFLGAYFLRKTVDVDVNISKTTSLPNLVFYQAGLTVLNMPLVTQIGPDNLDNNLFLGITGNPTIYAHKSLETVNNGAMEGDLMEAQSYGATIVFV